MQKKTQKIESFVKIDRKSKFRGKKNQKTMHRFNKNKIQKKKETRRRKNEKIVEQETFFHGKTTLSPKKHSLQKLVSAATIL